MSVRSIPANLPLPFSAVADHQKINNLFSLLKNTPRDSKEFQKNRNELFSNVQSLQRCLEKREIPSLKTDTCLRNAENVFNNRQFIHYPGSQGRLMPKAQGYLRSLLNLELCSKQQYDPIFFSRSLRSLFTSHEAFAKQYSEEAKIVYRHEPEMVRITHEAEISFFSTAFLYSLEECSTEKLDEMRQEISERDPKYVFSFAGLALEQALSLNSLNSTSIFSPFKKEFDALCSVYEKLSLDEHQAIVIALLGSEAVLSQRAKQVIDKINEIAVHAQRGGQSQMYAAIISNLYVDAEKCLILAKMIRVAQREETPKEDLSYSDKCAIVLYSAIACEEQFDVGFDFFKGHEIQKLRSQYKLLTPEQKKFNSKPCI